MVNKLKLIKHEHRSKASVGSKIFDAINIVLLVLLCITMAYPMWYIIILSFNDGADALKGGIWLLPRHSDY